MRAGFVLIAEIVASIAAAGVVSALFPGPMTVATSLSRGTTTTQGVCMYFLPSIDSIVADETVVIEMFLTAELVFTICMLAAEKHKGTFLAPIGIGLALFVAELAGVNFTGGSLNPVRSFGPAVINRSFPTYHWIYWVGPCLGSLLAVGFYRFYKVLEYETANPGADFDEKEDARFEFDEENAATSADVERPTSNDGQLNNTLSNSGQMTGQSPRSPDGAYKPMDAREEMHPGFQDAAYRNCGHAEQGQMRDYYRSR